MEGPLQTSFGWGATLPKLYENKMKIKGAKIMLNYAITHWYRIADAPPSANFWNFHHPFPVRSNFIENFRDTLETHLVMLKNISKRQRYVWL